MGLLDINIAEVSTMSEVKNKFSALTPELLADNQSVYDEALKYALENNDIKNIAITGVYGAGKSTVWRTYCAKENVNNVITVSLGKYEDNDIPADYCEVESERKIEQGENQPSTPEEQETPKTKHNNRERKRDSNNYCAQGVDTSDDNRIERQLINQILSQIDSKKIPLGKYRIKLNKSKYLTGFQTFCVCAIIFSVLSWVFRGTVISNLESSGITISRVHYGISCVALFFAPFYYFAYRIIRDNRLKISRINIKGAEANFNESENSEETVLDRDIKELVYLLSSSDAKVVVIEDLDRYDNIAIFTKLRELNFILNKYLETQDKNYKPIKFIYMIRDGLFVSKNRVKFFDFIIPIVPVIDSRNSENVLLMSLGDHVKEIGERLIFNISLYIDDMRLLKNIVNEFEIYRSILPVSEINLRYEKLFSLIVLKNVFPKEFDLLQEDKGYIYSLFNNVEEIKEEKILSLQREIDANNLSIDLLRKSVAETEFEVMALEIPTGLVCLEHKDKKWSEVLETFSKNKEAKYQFTRYSQNDIETNLYTYDDFIKQFNLKNEKTIRLIKNIKTRRTIDIRNLEKKNLLAENRIKDIKKETVHHFLSSLTVEERKNFFEATNNEILNSHYFPLIKLLIVEGNIDKTYWYYKSCFYTGSLKINDHIFMKALVEENDIDIFLELENPKEIINRLEEQDFRRFNILNKSILEECIRSSDRTLVETIIESTQENDTCERLIQIFDTFEYDLYKNLGTLFLATEDVAEEGNPETLLSVLEMYSERERNSYKYLIMAICSFEALDEDAVDLFKVHIEQSESIIDMMSDEEFASLLVNLEFSGIKFQEISICNNVDRIRKIEGISAYYLDINNVIFIAEKLLNKSICYGNLVSEIFNSEELSKSKEYIDSNFDEFITEYIGGIPDGLQFSNDEDIFVKIINSDIELEDKIRYISDNTTVFKKLSEITNLQEKSDLLNIWFEKNTIRFNSENVNTYWESVDDYSTEFTNYVDRNIKKGNYKSVFGNNKDMSNSFVNDPTVGNKVFGFAVEFANGKITSLAENTERGRVAKLIDRGLLAVNNNNLEILKKGQYFEEIVFLVDSLEENEKNQAVNILCDMDLPEELTYSLLKSSISDEDAIRLLDHIAEVKFAKLGYGRAAVVKHIVDNGLSDENINYICKQFGKFIFKNRFVKYMVSNRNFEEILNDNLSSSFASYFISSEFADIDAKIQILVRVIENKATIEELRDHFSHIEEVAGLTTVWENKHPELNDSYKLIVGEALRSAGYVSIRVVRGRKRIVAKKNR